jgi:NitT/TauT family transport system substrate-binding protein
MREGENVYERSEMEINKRPPRLQVLIAAATALAVALLVAACGGGGDTESGNEESSSEGETTTLKVGVIPIADVAPLYVGIDQGFFADENLEIEPQLASGGAVIVPSVVSGDFQVGFSNVTSLLIAASEGLPLQIIAQGVLGGAEAKQGVAWDGVLVPEDSPISEPADLEGKTIAVNTLNNVGPLTINTALDKAGVDYESVEYTEVEFPDMVGALDQGRVDAAWVVEPFLSQGIAEGDVALLYPYEETAESLTVATWFATSEYAEQNADVVDAFVRAINESNQYAAQNPDAVRKALPEYTEIPPEAAEQITLPVWDSDLNLPTIETTEQLAEKYGYVDEPVEVGDLIREQP